jgi:hypothetical protein
MRFVTFIVALIVAPLVVGFTQANAEEQKTVAPWQEACRHYHSSRHFVSESTPYCMRQSDQKACQQQAQRYFERCNFSGDFHKMSARMSARMLLVLALSSVRSVHQLDL